MQQKKNETIYFWMLTIRLDIPSSLKSNHAIVFCRKEENSVVLAVLARSSPIMIQRALSTVHASHTAKPTRHM